MKRAQLTPAQRTQYEFIRAEGHSKVVAAQRMGMSLNTLYRATKGDSIPPR